MQDAATGYLAANEEVQPKGGGCGGEQTTWALPRTQIDVAPNLLAMDKEFFFHFPFCFCSDSCVIVLCVGFAGMNTRLAMGRGIRRTDPPSEIKFACN